MYLSRLVFKCSPLTLNWLQNVYRVHQRVQLALPNDPRPLYRLEQGHSDFYHLLVQSAIQRPDWNQAFDDLPLLQHAETNLYNPHYRPGMQLAYRLRGCPTVTWNGRRYPLLNPAEQTEWLERKLLAAGAESHDCKIIKQDIQRAWKINPAGQCMTLTHHGVIFQGQLIVQDPVQLLAAVRNGVGVAKGLGFGLLSIMVLRW